MSSEWGGFVLAMILMFALVCSALIGASIRTSEIKDDCDAFGETRMRSAAYECKQVSLKGK